MAKVRLKSENQEIDWGPSCVLRAAFMCRVDTPAIHQYPGFVRKIHTHSRIPSSFLFL